MKFNPYQKLIFSIIASSIAVLAFGWLLVWLVGGIHKMSAGLRETDSKLARLEKERGQAKEADTMLKARAEDFSSIQAYFIDRDRPIDFIENLEDMAARTKNKISLAIDEKESAENILVFRLVLEGSERGVMDYLKLFELMPFSTEVKSLDLQNETSRRDEGPPVSRMTLYFTVKTKN